MKIKKTF